MRRRTPCLLATLLVTALSSVAAADEAPPEGDRYAALGLGGSFLKWAHGSLVLDAGQRLPGLPLWLHGRIAGGYATDLEMTGWSVRAEAGVEGRLCTRGGGLCGTLGLDAGVLGGRISDSDDVHGLLVPMAAARAGVEAEVAPHVVLSLTVEGLHMFQKNDGTDDPQFGAGIQLSLLRRW